MDRTTILRCCSERAHLAGAEAVILEKEATDLLAQAHSARQRYYRELEAIDLLLGNTPSPFAHLAR